MQTPDDLLRATRAGDMAGVTQCLRAGVPVDCRNEVGDETVQSHVKWKLHPLTSTAVSSAAIVSDPY